MLFWWFLYILFDWLSDWLDGYLFDSNYHLKFRIDTRIHSCESYWILYSFHVDGKILSANIEKTNYKQYTDGYSIQFWLKSDWDSHFLYKKFVHTPNLNHGYDKIEKEKC